MAKEFDFVSTIPITQRFYTNTNISKFIKGLVSKTSIPMIDFANNTPTHVINTLYIKDGYIQKYLGNEKWDKLEPYIIGKDYNGITTKFTSETGSYDSDTHYYLGQFLRMIKGCYGLNLMPFYNCYNNKYINDIKITETVTKGPIYYSTDSPGGSADIGDLLGNGSGKLEAYRTINREYNYSMITNPALYNDDYQTILVPIKFFKTYTVALDCPVPYYIMPIVYGNKGVAVFGKNNLIKKYCQNRIVKKSSSMFTVPYTFCADAFTEKESENLTDIIFEGKSNKAEIATQKIYSYEKFLYLLIQIPSNVKTTLTVLEGDFTHLANDKKFINDKPDEEFIRHYPNENPEDVLISKLTLLTRNDGNSYAFSDRLIEYLLLGVISPYDEISTNIKRIQKYAMSRTNAEVNKTPKYSPSEFIYGVWGNDLQAYLYNLVINSEYLSTKLDIVGFADKDVEKIITRGQGV